MLTDANGNATELITWYFVGRIALQFVFLSLVIYLLAECGAHYPSKLWNVSAASAGSTEAASLYLRQVEILPPPVHGLPRQLAKRCAKKSTAARRCNRLWPAPRARRRYQG